MSALSAALIRRRRIVLTAAVVAAVAYPVSRSFTATLDALLSELLYDGLVVAVLVAVVLVILTTERDKPPTLVIRPDVPSFESPLSATGVALALAFTLMTGGQAGSLFTRNRPLDLRIVGVALTVLLAAVAALHLVAAWQGLRVRLGPDGLSWRTPARSVAVPWAALVPDGPPRPELNANALALSYGRPELVRRRGPGWRLDRFPVGRIHPWFLSDVIRHYVAHPEHRSAIGTETEYHRLLGALGVTPASAAPGPVVP